MDGTRGWRRGLLTVDGALLALTGGVQALGDAASHFFGRGPLGARLMAEPGTLGFFEAHGLALLVGLLLLGGRREPGPRWFVVAAAVHLFLGGANLLYWPSFAHYGMAHVGAPATALHAVLFLLQAAAALSLRPALVQGPGALFRWTALLTLAGGLALHGTSLALGREAFVQRVFSPGLDLLLALPMTVAGLSGWWALRLARPAGRLQRALHVLLLVYFSVSIPVHLQVLVTGRTDYVFGFPEWYSVPLLALLPAAAALVLSLRFERPGPVARAVPQA
jgi:hypothetical protein